MDLCLYARLRLTRRKTLYIYDRSGLTQFQLRNFRLAKFCKIKNNIFLKCEKNFSLPELTRNEKKMWENNVGR
jgi:hypothetical protein